MTPKNDEKYAASSPCPPNPPRRPSWTVTNPVTTSNTANSTGCCCSNSNNPATTSVTGGRCPCYWLLLCCRGALSTCRPHRSAIVSYRWPDDDAFTSKALVNSTSTTSNDRPTKVCTKYYNRTKIRKWSHNYVNRRYLFIFTR